MDLNKVKDTIAKLLNLANNDAAAQGEVANAMRFAAKLMEQHQLTEEDVILNKTEDVLLNLEKATMAEVSGWMGGNKFCHWESDAASFACAFVGGIKWFYRDRVPYKVNGIQQMHTGKYAHKKQLRTMVTFYGIQEDVEVAYAVYNELIMTIASMAKLRWGAVYRGEGRNYCEGFMQGLFGKWYADQDQQRKLAHQQGSACTALAVIDNRQLVVKRKTELAEQWIEKRHKLRSGSKTSSQGMYSHEARTQGREDGRNYNASKPTPKPRLTSK